MQNIKFIILFLAFIPLTVHAQQESKSSKQTRTIEINNENGNLYISFSNNNIEEFTVNDEPVAVEKYDIYQLIIDEFNDDEPTPPTPPVPNSPEEEDNNSETIRTMLVDFLTDLAIITSDKKYKVELKRKHLKVNGEKLSDELHQECLNLFSQVYGHQLNDGSKVKFKKSKRNSSSTIRIVK